MPTTTATKLSQLLRRGLQVIVLNCAIALALTEFGNYSLASNLIFSHCIGLTVWGLIECGMAWLVQGGKDGDKQWWRMLLIVPVSAVVGFVVGNLLGSALTGYSSQLFEPGNTRWKVGLVTLNVVMGAIVSYYFMSRRELAQLRERSLQAQKQASEARLQLLQSQLEPHMLFNTLANLRVLVASDPVRAQAMLDSLIAYLRATLMASRTDAQGTPHTLATEFELLQDYLSLLSIRMGPRLAYVLDLPEALRSQQVPPLLLQPLAENAIKHGLEPSIAGGEIRICAGLHDHILQLEVLDTGVGLAGDAPEVVANGGSGFGLAHVRERLATLHGSQAQMTIQRIEPHGTRVVLTLPASTTLTPLPQAATA